MYNITQMDLDILRQSNKQLYVKLELLNHSMKVIDSIEGNLISDSYTIDAESDIRRTYNCELHITDSSFLLGADNKFFIDRYIRPYIGIIHQRSGNVVWYLQGTYTINEMNYTFDESSNTLSLTCSDLMCTLTAERGSMMEGLEIVIEAGADIRKSIIAILDDAKISKYRIDDVGKEIPYDLEHSAGSTFYDLLKEIVELYAGWEMFFDVDGTFVVQKIPTLKTESSILNSEIIDPLIISEEYSNSYNKIYNYTQVWGKVIETDYYTQVCSGTSTAYTASFEILTEIKNFRKYGVRVHVTNGVNPMLNLNGLGSKKIVNDDGKQLAPGVLITNTDYVFKYRKASDDLLLLGQYQAYGEYKQTENELPYSTGSLGYELKQVLSYDNLESDDLCRQRAKYETWLTTSMKDTIDLSLVTIPFLDVNWKISYTSLISEQTGEYIIKNISGSNSEFTQNVSMIRFNELYPDII